MDDGRWTHLREADGGTRDALVLDGGVLDVPRATGVA